mgnify:CR=1 FL=1
MILGFKGYLGRAEYGPAPLSRIFRSLTMLVSWLGSLLPQSIKRAPAPIKTDFT